MSLTTKLNTLFNRFFGYRISTSHLYREMHTRRLMEKALQDNAVLFWDYNDFSKRNVEIFSDYLKSNSVSSDRALGLEFGVAGGTTLNFVSGLLKDVRFWGFDSFEGFKDVKKSSIWFSYQERFTGQKLPEVNENVQLVKGYVEDTFPKFISENASAAEVFYIHCDMDVYEPTRVVLNWVVASDKKVFVLFDELLNYNEFHLHEYRAFLEAIIARNIPYRIHTLCDRGADIFGAYTKVFIEIR